MKLFYQYMAIFFNFSLTSNHFHPLQVENCDSNSRLVVDEDDYGKLRLERVNGLVKQSKNDYSRAQLWMLRQILMSKDSPRSERIQKCIMAEDP